MDIEKRLPQALLCLRLSIFLVMMVWTVEKVLHPDHMTKVFEGFYFIPGVGAQILLIIALLELVLLVAFLLGVKKTWTYGAVLAFHFISTLSSYEYYFHKFNLLFFAAWPMLAACFALYYLREADKLWIMSGSGSSLKDG